MAKNVATVEDFERLKNVDTGLVPMVFLVPTITEIKGDIRGAEPGTALRWYNTGLAEPLKKLSAKPVEPNAGQSFVTDEDKRKAGVEIPENWSGIHHLQRIALGKKIAGDDSVTSAAAADQVIQAELDRRGMAAGIGPNAVTSASLTHQGSAPAALAPAS